MDTVLSWHRDPVLQKQGQRGYLKREEYQRGAKDLSALFWEIGARKLDQLDSVRLIEQLRIPPGNKLEALSGNGN